MATMMYTGELTVVVCWCGIKHAVPSELRKFQLSQHEDGKNHFVCCPLGHKYVPAGESKAEILERQLQRERQRHDQTRADRDYKENQRRAEKAAKTKLKKRIAAGVCPCCNRTFQNLAKHMKGQHPEYVESE